MYLCSNLHLQTHPDPGMAIRHRDHEQRRPTPNQVIFLLRRKRKLKLLDECGSDGLHLEQPVELVSVALVVKDTGSYAKRKPMQPRMPPANRTIKFQLSRIVAATRTYRS